MTALGECCGWHLSCPTLTLVDKQSLKLFMEANSQSVEHLYNTEWLMTTSGRKLSYKWHFWHSYIQEIPPTSIKEAHLLIYSYQFEQQMVNTVFSIYCQPHEFYWCMDLGEETRSFLWPPWGMDWSQTWKGGLVVGILPDGCSTSKSALTITKVSAEEPGY